MFPAYILNKPVPHSHWASHLFQRVCSPLKNRIEKNRHSTQHGWNHPGLAPGVLQRPWRRCETRAPCTTQPVPPQRGQINPEGSRFQMQEWCRDTRTGLALGSPGTEVEQAWSCDAASEQLYLWIQMHLMFTSNCIFKVRHYYSCEQAQSARTHPPESSPLLTSLGAAAVCAQVRWLLCWQR